MPTVQGVCQSSTLPWPATLAPFWHTRALVAFILTVALLGALQGPVAPTSARISGYYLPLGLVSLLLSGYVLWGTPRHALHAALQEARRSLPRLGTDGASATLFVLLVLVTDGVLSVQLGLPESVASHALLPQSPAEKVCWVLVACCVGSSEELVYRGYLQRQLAALSGRPWLGVLLQALLFGIAHGEQGGSAVLRVSAYGFGFGVLAIARGGLLPCVLAHIALDLYAGFLG